MSIAYFNSLTIFYITENSNAENENTNSFLILTLLYFRVRYIKPHVGHTSLLFVREKSKPPVYFLSSSSKGSED